MNSLHAYFLAVAAMAAAPLLAHADGDPAVGKGLYAARCAACHSLEYNGVGPTHKGLIGRRAGTAQGYSYSEALKHSDVVWGEQTISRWLTEPEKFIPGQKMFISIPDARERADIVAYLMQAARPQQSATTNTPRKPGE
jgi:cytochrome c